MGTEIVVIHERMFSTSSGFRVIVRTPLTQKEERYHKEIRPLFECGSNSEMRKNLLFIGGRHYLSVSKEVYTATDQKNFSPRMTEMFLKRKIRKLSKEVDVWVTEHEGILQQLHEHAGWRNIFGRFWVLVCMGALGVGWGLAVLLTEMLALAR